MIDVEKILKENMERIKTEYKFENVEDDDSILSTLPEEDYIFYISYKLHYWLDKNVLYKVCTYFDSLAVYMQKNKVDFDKLNDACQIVITAAKYYVRGVLRVKEVYNL